MIWKFEKRFQVASPKIFRTSNQKYFSKIPSFTVKKPLIDSNYRKPLKTVRFAIDIKWAVPAHLILLQFDDFCEKYQGWF